jgi:non-ribosomal peptide synthetase component F
MVQKFAEFRKAEIEQSISDRFEEQVQRHSKALAVKTREHAWTYEQLNAFANRIARSILRERSAKQQVAALLLDQGAPLIGAILGILKAGQIYVALDHTHPVARIAWMLDDADAFLIITDTEHLALAQSLSTNRRRVINVDDLLSDEATENASLPITPDSLAYLFYTSGSTGKPKGVVDTHRNVLHNVMRYTNNLCITASDRLTLLQSASFSGAVSSMFGALLNGASLFPFDLRKEGTASLARWLQDEAITMYHSVPAIFRSFLLGNITFPFVRVVRLRRRRINQRCGNVQETFSAAVHSCYWTRCN